MNKTFSPIGLAFVLAGLLMPHLALAAQAAAQQSSEQSLPTIMVVGVTERKMVDRIIVTGTVRSVEEVYVSPEVEGLQIKTMNVDVGDTVKKGDVLAVLNDDALVLQKSQLEANKARVIATGAQVQAQYSEAKANGDEAMRQAIRAETLALSGTVATSKAEQLRAVATASLARVNSAEQAIEGNKADIKVVDTQIDDINLRLARTDVKSPVSGVISARNAKMGGIASGAGQPLFSIIRDGSVEMVADVAESDILKLQPGQKARLTVAGGREMVDGTVRLVEPTVDGVTRLGKVRISIMDPMKARVGMYASAEIIVSERVSPALPLTALTAEKSAMTARKIEDNRVKMVNVETGVIDGEFIEIISGLKAGDDVVQKAGAYVRDGDRIKPIHAESNAAN